MAEETKISTTKATTHPEDNGAKGQGRTFTQDEVNAIVSKRLAEERSKADNEYKTKYETLVQQIESEKAENVFQVRFDIVSQDKVFVNDLTKSGVYNLFKEALSNPANVGKTDAEIYESIVKDKNYYENPNKPADMAGMGSIPNVEESAIKQAMGLEKGV